MALVDKGPHGVRICAVNAVALRSGVCPDQSLSDARAVLPSLASMPLEPAADLLALRRLARWFGRYGPNRNLVVMRSPAGRVLDHGIWIDVAGVEHLYRGEEGLLDHVSQRLKAAGLTARLGLADSYGAAYALARFGCLHNGIAVALPGQSRQMLAGLSVGGLRLAPDAVRLLRRLGLYAIGDLYDLPRVSLARRFCEIKGSRSTSWAGGLAQAILMRLDQALGLLAEPLRPLGEPPVLSVRKSYPDILITAVAVRAEIESLLEELCRGLEAAGLGLRRLRLLLMRSDGTSAHIMVGTSSACRSPTHLMRLIGERLDGVDAGFGIDAVVMEVLRAQNLPEDQKEIATDAFRAMESLEQLLDRLINRSNGIRVFGVGAQASHIPERAVVRCVPWGGGGGSWLDAPWKAASRPPLLLSRPEPIDVLAEVPEGAPARFTWRRIVHRVHKSEGPERLLPEWWRHLEVQDEDAFDDAGLPGLRRETSRLAAARDYYRVEVEGGARYWVFRDGLYADDMAVEPRWFLHGLFG